MSAPNQWAWTFYASDGTTVLGTSALQNPSFTFPAAGPFFARLIATLTTMAPPNSGDSGLVAFPVAPVAGPPTITITQPTAATTYPTQSPTIILTGTATDVTGVAWANTTTGAGGPATGLNAWTTPSIILQSGANVLVVTGFGQSPNATDTLTVTYTPLPPAIPLPPDLMRGFGPGRGVAATDAIQTPLTAHAAQRSILFWYRRDGLGARCLFTKSTIALPNLTESILALGDGLLRIRRQYSGGTGEWTCPEPVAGARHCLVLKIDTGAPTALPILKIDNVIQTLTVVRQPAGGETPVSNAAGYMLGNWPGGTGSVLGDLAKWALYNRVTTDQEDTDFYEGDNPMTIGVAPVAYHKLDGTVANEPDSVTTTVSVLTGTVVQNYAVVAPPTVTLAVTTGNPATRTPYQVTATTTGTVDRVSFVVDGGTPVVRTVAPYLLFASPSLLGPTPSPHVIVASVFDTPGGTADDTATLNVTEPSATAGWTVDYELCDRVANALSYNLYLNGVFHSNTLQPASGNHVRLFPGYPVPRRRVAGHFGGANGPARMSAGRP